MPNTDENAITSLAVEESVTLELEESAPMLSNKPPVKTMRWKRSCSKTECIMISIFIFLACCSVFGIATAFIEKPLELALVKNSFFFMGFGFLFCVLMIAALEIYFKMADKTKIMWTTMFAIVFFVSCGLWICGLVMFSEVFIAHK